MHKLFLKLSLVFVLLLSSFTFVACTKKDSLEGFPEFNDIEHVYEKIDYSKMKDKLTLDTGKTYILFGFSECPYCRTAMPIINEAAIEARIKVIYYFDIKQIRDDKSESYLDLLEIISSQVDDLELDDKGEVKLTVPDLYVVEAGEIFRHHIATIKNDEGRYIKDLTDNEKKELKDIYLELFN